MYTLNGPDVHLGFQKMNLDPINVLITYINMIAGNQVSIFSKFLELFSKQKCAF